MSIDDPVRSVMDVAFSVVASLGLHKFSVSLVTVTNSGGSRPGVGGTRTKTVTPLLLANGQPVLCEQVSAKDVILSGNVLKDKDFRIGPQVFPYTTPNAYGVSGGTDFNIYDPPSNNTATDNLQVYYLITGPGLAAAGNYFEKIYSREDSALSYYLFVRNLGTTIL
jgi:hypothetical protein